MSDINVFTVSGRLTSDCQVTNKDSYNIINFSIASNYFYKKNNEEKTSFFNCIYFTKSEKISEYLKKGCQVFVNCKIIIETYEKDGNKKQSTKLYVISLLPIFKQKDNATNNKDPYDYSDSEECPF